MFSDNKIKEDMFSIYASIFLSIKPSKSFALALYWPKCLERSSRCCFCYYLACAYWLESQTPFYVVIFALPVH